MKKLHLLPIMLLAFGSIQCMKKATTKDLATSAKGYQVARAQEAQQQRQPDIFDDVADGIGAAAATAVSLASSAKKALTSSANKDRPIYQYGNSTTSAAVASSNSSQANVRRVAATETPAKNSQQNDPVKRLQQLEAQLKRLPDLPEYGETRLDILGEMAKLQKTVAQRLSDSLTSDHIPNDRLSNYVSNNQPNVIRVREDRAAAQRESERQQTETERKNQERANAVRANEELIAKARARESFAKIKARNWFFGIFASIPFAFLSWKFNFHQEKVFFGCGLSSTFCGFKSFRWYLLKRKEQRTIDQLRK